MTQILDDLVALLKLEQIEENLFRGVSQDLGFRQLYGGQVIGQALSAASQTLEETRHVHSMHGYFLRPGDASKPVVYHVDRVRDGGSFSTRRVTAIQKGKPIFFLSASFQYDEEGFEHQGQMPDVVGPENLPTEVELTRKHADLIPERIRDKLLCPKPIEIRPVSHVDPYDPQPMEPVKYYWFRANGKLPDTPALHKYLLAYASDFDFITTSMMPHGVSVRQETMQVASIDHSIWFHRDLRADEWLLYAMDSPWSGNGRGFARGSIYNREGQLVASTAQEGLIRQRKDRA
ncbi:acyl-CoA thioesterase II [Pseudomonas schmalbachii]|uniref:Acyl-CoA thioesterase II n=1 Tax=Pseudomonas schmalbachii TaxID=2816993 RepID=A0ABS3TT77_9PSED|nr:acyl-CoA thioesterase II [Pseudomonas schmalbachii]MBO3276876.1 acyl-CoA thioesterase II [Pseudomonas schmalbachii]